MKIYGIFLLLFVWANVAISADESIPLKLVKALPVEGIENSQPSGLTIFNNQLFTISDKHDDTIFRIQLMEDKAVLVPYIQFQLTEAVEGILDLEGITCDENGNFYIISEGTFRILKVDANRKEASWLTPSLRPDGEKVGLFQTKGAYIEGITSVGNKQFVVCAERQPRGIIEVDTNTTPFGIRAFKYNKTKAKLPKNRHPDFTGLFWENGILYTLERNAYTVCKLIKSSRGFEEKDLWSYENIVTSEEFQYENMRFGRAEGLCMDTKHIYVILDNNGDARLSDPSDHRPLLLIIERPDVKR